LVKAGSITGYSALPEMIFPEVFSVYSGSFSVFVFLKISGTKRHANVSNFFL